MRVLINGKTISRIESVISEKRYDEESLTVVIIIGILYYFCRDKKNHKLFTIPLALVFGGALGNLLDRVMYGFVIDFIDFNFWPAFNIADSAITVGVIFLIIYVIKNKPKKRKIRKKRKV